MHTGGLTGAEVGVAAATAFLNQKLLAALFGEAAMAELDRRRADGGSTRRSATTFEEERARFDALLPAPGVLAEPRRRPARPPPADVRAPAEPAG